LTSSDAFTVMGACACPCHHEQDREILYCWACAEVVCKDIRRVAAEHGLTPEQLIGGPR
jgi:hypothetical protein